MIYPVCAENDSWFQLDLQFGEKRNSNFISELTVAPNLLVSKGSLFILMIQTTFHEKIKFPVKKYSSIFLMKRTFYKKNQRWDRRGLKLYFKSIQIVLDRHNWQQQIWAQFYSDILQQLWSICAAVIVWAFVFSNKFLDYWTKSSNNLSLTFFGCRNFSDVFALNEIIVQRFHNIYDWFFWSIATAIHCFRRMFWHDSVLFPFWSVRRLIRATYWAKKWLPEWNFKNNSTEV